MQTEAPRSPNTIVFGRPVTMDSFSKMVVAICLAICSWFLKGAFERLDAHENRITRMEARAENAEETMKEIKISLHEMNGKLDRLNERKP